MLSFVQNIVFGDIKAEIFSVGVHVHLAATRIVVHATHQEENATQTFVRIVAATQILPIGL